MKHFVLSAALLAVSCIMAFGSDPGTPVSKTTVSPKAINLDFVLVNRTGYAINGLYVAPSTTRSWGDDLMEGGIIDDGEYVEITFDGDQRVRKWDIYVTWDGYASDEDVYWIGFDLSEISEITLHFDESTGKTWAVTK